MSITDELKEWAIVEVPYKYGHQLLAIADRIDSAHEEALVNSYFDGVFSDEELAENGWVRLPKDADGEYIHIGDRMENGERVERIVLTDGSWEPYVYLAKTPYVLHEYFCNEISHYKQPTVEDVLREFARDFDAWRNYSGPVNESPSNPVAEYAAKLREMLAGDGE